MLEEALQQTELTADQKAHVRRLLIDLGVKFIGKYAKGQKEHGGNMWQKPGMLYCLEDEVLDFISYVGTVSYQLKTRVPEHYKWLTSPGEKDK